MYRSSLRLCNILAPSICHLQFLAATATGAVLYALTLPNRDCRLGVRGCGSHALLDLAGHGEESLFDVGSALRGGLKEGDAKAVCEFL